MKGALLSGGEVQTTFKAIRKFTCANCEIYYGRKKFTSIDEAQLDIFLKKYKPKKNDVLEGSVRKIDGGCLPPYFRVLKSRFCKQYLLVTCGIMPSIQI